MGIAENEMLKSIPGALGILLGMPREKVRVKPGQELLLDAGGYPFLADLLRTATPGLVSNRCQLLLKKRHSRKVTPLLVVPYMGDASRRVCEAVPVSWMDLSGNARIVAPGLRVMVEGKPNRFLRAGRPSNVFAPKSARVVRWLLMHQDQRLTQRQIARDTEMAEGFVSRIASRLVAENYVTRDDSGGLEIVNPSLLLDAWNGEYNFNKHRIIQGHVASRSGDALTQFVSDTLSKQKIDHAATGLSAAWQMTKFVSFRIATFFLAEEPSEELKVSLGFRPEPSGANLWLVTPNDSGVFQGTSNVDGVRCVHPVQAFLDLGAHPERSAEAADRLRAEHLKWSSNDH